MKTNNNSLLKNLLDIVSKIDGNKSFIPTGTYDEGGVLDSHYAVDVTEKVCMKIIVHKSLNKTSIDIRLRYDYVLYPNQEIELTKEGIEKFLSDIRYKGYVLECIEDLKNVVNK